MDKVLMSGNNAIGEAAIRAGCQCYFGYPITPQNELTEYMATHLSRKKGCSLPRELRSYICLQWSCKYSKTKNMK